jgi:hypothetical protein
MCVVVTVIFEEYNSDSGNGNAHQQKYTETHYLLEPETSWRLGLRLLKLLRCRHNGKYERYVQLFVFICREDASSFRR